LALAAERFHVNAHLVEARRIGAAVLARETVTVGALRILVAVPWARPSRAVNVGYLMFNALSRLWWATGFDPGWVAVAATGRQLLGTAMAASPHLPPDWSQVRADGSVLAAVTAQATLDAVAAHAPRFARIVAEPALAPVSSGWTWCASGASGGFVRTADGGAFAVGAAPAGGVLPPELVAALAQAPRGGGAPASVVVTQPCTDALLAQWRASTGVAFERGEPWRWDDAPESAYAAAPDLLRAPEIAAPARGAALRLWKPAAAIALAAVALHVVATIAQWSWLRIDAWRSGERIVALAQGAGVADAATPDAALRALARRDAELRHRAGLAAASDAVPLLARAAPALAALPAAAVKSATFADGAWTFELATLDDAARAALDRRMQDNGLTALQARTAAGARMRVTPAP